MTDDLRDILIALGEDERVGWPVDETADAYHRQYMNYKDGDWQWNYADEYEGSWCCGYPRETGVCRTWRSHLEDWLSNRPQDWKLCKFDSIFMVLAVARARASRGVAPFPSRTKPRAVAAILERKEA